MLLFSLYQTSERYLQAWMTDLRYASFLEILIGFQCPEELEIGNSVMGLGI